MVTNDVRDVLNLPQQDGAAAPRPAKKQKLSGPRPNLKGLAREVQNLGGDNPIAIVPEMPHFKKRRFASRKPAAHWDMRPFTNSAREDGSLVLRHWRRADMDESIAMDSAGAPGSGPDGDGPAPKMEEDQTSQQPRPKVEDSAFAKFNAQVQIPTYTEDQYHDKLQDDDWTKEETDYLVELAGDFDLRWPLIWDRYAYSPPVPEGEGEDEVEDSAAIIAKPKDRSMEDLKKRYYEVAAKVMEISKPLPYMSGNEHHLHDMMLNFDAPQERARKQFANHALARSREEANEETSLLLEIKRIQARMDRFNDERRELYERLDYPRGEPQNIEAFKTSAGLQTLLQNLLSADRNKKRKSLMANEGTTPGGTGSANANGGTPASAGAETPTAAPNDRRRGGGSSGGGGGGGGSESGPSTSGATKKEDAGRESVEVGGNEKAAPPPPTKEKNNKKGQPPPERRKLTDQEEQVYGVTHHERPGTGPTFRYEKVNKLFAHKSGQQQLRINNVLNELEIPLRLFMPTAAVTAQFEQLVVAATALVDQRKVHDKLEGEIRIEEAKKAERERIAAAKAAEERGNANGGDGDDDDDGSENEDKPSNSQQPGAGGGTNGKKAETSQTDKPQTNGDHKPNHPRSEKKGQSGESREGKEQEDENEEDEEESNNGDEAGANGNEAGVGATDEQAAKAKASDQRIKQEEAGGGEKENGVNGAGSGNTPTSTTQKRSASVMSATSDKSSSKRQKK